MLFEGYGFGHNAGTPVFVEVFVAHRALHRRTVFSPDNSGPAAAQAGYAGVAEHTSDAATVMAQNVMAQIVMHRQSPFSFKSLSQRNR